MRRCYIGLDVHKKKDQLLWRGRKRPDSLRRRDCYHTISPGQLNEDVPAAMDSGNGIVEVAESGLVQHLDPVQPQFLRQAFLPGAEVAFAASRPESSALPVPAASFPLASNGARPLCRPPSPSA